MAVAFHLHFPYCFVGKKPVAVVINGEKIPVNNWRKVYKVILQDCIKDPARHEKLLELRGRLSGWKRIFISDSPDKMRSPHKIAEGIYAELHYGSQTLMHILTLRVLRPLGYDYSKIVVLIE